MINFNVQLNNVNEIKTLNEIVKETFSIKSPVVDISFFYQEGDDTQKTKEFKDNEVKLSYTEQPTQSYTPL